VPRGRRTKVTKETIMKRIFLSILMLTALLATSCNGNSTAAPTAELTTNEIAPTTVTAEGTLLPERSAELAFAQGGVVKEVLVQAGEQVAEGDVIARLIGIESVQAELAAAKLEQTLAQQALDSIHRNALLTSSQTEQALLDAQKIYESEANGWNLGNRDEATDLELNIEDYVIAEEDYRDARQKLNDVLYLNEDDRDRRDAQEDFDAEKESLAEAYVDLKTVLSENEKPLDEELTALLSAISNLESARELQARLDDSNLDPEILAASESRLEAANAHVAAAEAAIESYELRAPFSGSLINTDLSPGETALPMTPVAFIADNSQWIVKTKDLAEVDVAKVSVGDSVAVKLDAFPDEEFAGTVTDINPIGKLYLGDMTYQVTIALDENDPRFLWNMTTVVTVDTEN
jgi:multidrug efflux pump subunit AcrA (membrane-fusion protein)